MKTPLAEAFSEYIRLFPEERRSLQLLSKQIHEGGALNDRRNFNGHITGSAVVLSPDRQKVLLIHHRLFNVWQQPGGHWEPNDADPLAAAQREVVEETGVRLIETLSVKPSRPLVPLDIGTHEVPPRPQKDEPEHFHHDLRYVFLAAGEALQHQDKEVTAARWFALDNPAVARIARPVKKLKQFHFI